MAQDFLSQEEVDALLKGVTGETDEQEADEGAGDGIRPYNLATSEGREELADEIKEEANDVLGYAPNPKKKNKRSRPEDDGPVLAVLFNQFIVQ